MVMNVEGTFSTLMRFILKRIQIFYFRLLYVIISIHLSINLSIHPSIYQKHIFLSRKIPTHPPECTACSRFFNSSLSFPTNSCFSQAQGPQTVYHDTEPQRAECHCESQFKVRSSHRLPETRRVFISAMRQLRAGETIKRATQ